MDVNWRNDAYYLTVEAVLVLAALAALVAAAGSSSPSASGRSRSEAGRVPPCRARGTSRARIDGRPPPRGPLFGSRYRLRPARVQARPGEPSPVPRAATAGRQNLVRHRAVRPQRGRRRTPPVRDEADAHRAGLAQQLRPGPASGSVLGSRACVNHAGPSRANGRRAARPTMSGNYSSGSCGSFACRSRVAEG